MKKLLIKKIPKKYEIVIKVFLAVIIVGMWFLPCDLIKGEETDADFTEWTEYDPYSDLVVTQDQITITTWDYGHAGRVYYDFGEGYFANDEGWNIYFTFRMEDAQLSSGCGILVMSNENSNSVGVSDWIYNATADYLGIVPHRDTTGMRFEIREKLSPTTEYHTGEITIGTTEQYYQYYLDPEVGTYGTVYLKQYSDPDYAPEHYVQQLTLALHEANDWRYLNAVFPWGTSGASGYVFTSGYLKDVMITAGVDPEVINDTETWLYYDTAVEEHVVRLAGNITEDAGVNQYATVYWKNVEDEDYFSHTLYGTYSEGESFNYSVHMEPGETYSWYCGITSAEMGSFYSEAENYTCNITGYPPDMSTNFFYEFTANGSNSIAFLTGSCDWDGGANVTAYMQYSENTTDWTDSDPYGSTINTGENFTVNVTSLSQGTLYYYRSKGVNEYGTSYGGIFQFEINDWAEPDLTISHSNITGDSVDLTIILTDDGNESSIYTNYRLRASGQTEWTTDFIGEYMTENQSRTFTVVFLSPSTVYEYQGYAFGQCYMQGECEIAYTPIQSFATPATGSTPTVQLNIVGYHDSYTAYGTAEVLNDSAQYCIVSLEYKPAGSDYSHWARNILLHPDQFCDALRNEDTCTTFVTNLVLGESYDFRARIHNEVGKFSYSNTITYTHEAGGSSTTPGGAGDGTIAGTIDSWLSLIGLDNNAGHLLFTFVVMILVWLIVFIPGNRWMEMIKVTAPVAGMLDAIALIFFMSIGFVPVVVTVIIVIVFCSIVAGFVVRTFTNRHAEV